MTYCKIDKIYMNPRILDQQRNSEVIFAILKTKLKLMKLNQNQQGGWLLIKYGTFVIM